jgi:hypothetical protein
MERIISVETVQLKICLSKQAFEQLNEKNTSVDAEESIMWIKNNVVGKITKSELDDERNKETNALDMMQNSGMIYHMESMLEM